MDASLTKEDWERILTALSHFRHNTEMAETYQKVRDILNPPKDQANKS